MTDPNVKQTVRTQSQVHESADKAPLPTPTQPGRGEGSAGQNLAESEFAKADDVPSVSSQLSASVTPAPEPPSLGLKKETARIVAAPERLLSAGEIKNSEPAIPMPHVVPQDSSIVAEAARKKSSMLLSWILLAVSALILIIQIWIYVS